MLFCPEDAEDAGVAAEVANCCTCKPALLTGDGEAERPAVEGGLLVYAGFACAERD